MLQSTDPTVPEDGNELVALSERRNFDTADAVQTLAAHEGSIAIDPRRAAYTRVLQALEHGRLADRALARQSLAEAVTKGTIIRL